MNDVNLKAYILPLLMLFLGFTAPLSAQTKLNNFFDKADDFLSSNVKNGEVPYKAIKQEPATLNELVKAIGAISLDDAKPAARKAFYINAYNLLTIYSIIQQGIPDSPMDIDGFFDTIQHTVAGEQLTLNDIEKKRLLPVFNDPRIHFAVVCAAVSCPPIRPFAYRPTKLDDQLNTVTKKTLNSDFIRINATQKTAQISEIFKWYKQDFLKKADSVRAFINQYRSKEIPDDYTLDYYDYDWSSNRQ